MASLAGAVLQISKQALALKYNAKLPFMDSKQIGSLGIEQVIWEGRNRAVHWEENQPHPPITKMLETLGRENGLEIAIGKINSPTIVYALGWKTADDVINYLAKLIGFGGLVGGPEVLKPPMFGLAYALSKTVELFYSHGEGFHSNDVRRVTAAIDPLSGESVESIPLYSKQRGQEVGVRIEGWRNLFFSLTAFELISDSELIFVGDAGSTEPVAGSKRYGLETALFWSLGEQWRFDINSAFVRSRYTGLDEDEQYVPSAQEQVASAGIEYSSDGQGWGIGARCRHFGDTPLVEDNSVRGKSTTLCNLLTTYAVNRVQMSAEIINVFDREAADIAYWYGSRTASETEVIDDVHYHPVVPRTLRLGVRYAL